MKVLEKIQDMYLALVPYEGRPGNIWYEIKCWAWHRHSTIKPRGLGHTWVDKCHLMPHVIFEMLSQFVEDEVKLDIINWDAQPDTKKAIKEIMELYHWWVNDYNDDEFDFSLTNPEYSKFVLNQCKRVIDVSPYMWT